MKNFKLYLAAFSSVIAIATSAHAGVITPPTTDLSSKTLTPSGVSTSYSATMATLTAESGILVDTFKLASDPDDTLSFTRACASGLPTILGPRKYITHDLTCATNSFILHGVPGFSEVQRASAASGSQQFQINASYVSIDGVIFDFNKAAVTANQWPVYISAPTGNPVVKITNSVFENNSGTLGECLVIAGVGPSGNGSYDVTHNEFTGCSFNSAYFTSIGNGEFAYNYVHDNTRNGVTVTSNGTASSTNYAWNGLFEHNTIVRNATGISVGGYSAPYNFTIPPAIGIAVSSNQFQDNSSYNMTLQGDHINAIGNQISQSTTSVTTFGGIDCNGRYGLISLNDVTLAGASYGIDCGGSTLETVKSNNINMTTGAAVDIGGNQGSTVQSNEIVLSGSALAVEVYEIEADGSGIPFPTISSNTQIKSNTIYRNATGTIGIETFDNAGGRSGSGPTVISDNDFFATSGVTSANDIVYSGAGNSINVYANRHNGSKSESVDVNANGDIVFDNVFDQVQAATSSSTTVRSFINPLVNSYGIGGSIIYVEPSAGGSGYVQSTTTLSASATGGGSGWVGTPLVSGGAIIGVRVTSKGTGYTGTVTITATDTSGGSGATFTAGTVAQVPALKPLTYYGGTINRIINNTGGYNTINSTYNIYSGPIPISIQSASDGASWNLMSPPSPPPIAIGSLPVCSSTYNGIAINVTGSTNGQILAQCNGTNWIWSSGGVLTGSVASLASTGTTYYNSNTTAAYNPTVTISSPNVTGGTQATAAITNMPLISYGSVSAGGTGYTNGDVLSYTDPTSGIATQWTATVSSGVVTALTGKTAGSVTKIPLSPTALTGGTGSGASVGITGWKVAATSFNITNPGSGYTSVTASFSNSPAVLGPSTATGTVSNDYSALNSCGEVVLRAQGTLLGVVGTTGCPVVSYGASVDGSGVRQSLGTTYSVPANTSLVRFTQTSTVVASTVTLPYAAFDGQVIQFVNYSGSITALTFSPTVGGWSAGSTLATYTGLRIRWDSSAAAWIREQ